MSGEDSADYQLGIYMAGMAGQRPELPVAIEDLEAAARESLDEGAYAYVAGSAGAERTAAANTRAFDTWQIVPRHLRDVADRDHEVEVLGTRAKAPVWVAPVGMLGIIHEEAGYGAVVVTIDTGMLAWRERDLERAYLPALKGEGLANYLTDPIFAEELGCDPTENVEAAVLHWARNMGTLSHTWEDLAELRQMTDLPVVLKGILHPEDARMAVGAGVDGIIVSNHGGRQVDGAIPALRALPAVLDAVHGKIPVLFDSGIRRGTDIVKALALGAHAVLVGRPWVWGLALAGEEGVRTVLQRLLADYDLTMGLSGYTRPDELSRDALVPSE